MRQLFLRNENGEVFDFMDTSSFLSEPKGFGMSKTLDYMQGKYTRRHRNDKYDFKSITGDLIIKGYDKYMDFLNFKYNSQILYLVYKPLDKEYYTMVDLITTDKGEIEYDLDMMIVPVTMDQLSFWVTDEKIYMTEEDPGIVTEAYPYTYPFTHGISSSVTSEISVTLNNNGHLLAPLKIELFGYGNTPYWFLDSQSGELDLIIQNGSTVIIDSREEVFKATQNLANISNLLNPLKENFIFAPKGESTITFKNISKVEVTLYEQFTSV